MTTTDRVQDPVCGMRFDPDRAATAVELDGRTYHFCCDGCRKEFEADPRRFIRREP